MPRVQDIISQIVSLKSDTEIKFEDLKGIIDNALPGWITSIISEYSQDYSHFTNNWNHVTTKINTTKKYILLVDENVNICNIESKKQDGVPSDMSGIIQLFCETLTAIGCIVRLNTDFIECKKCNKAIPSEKIYNMFKQHNGSIIDRKRHITIPETWSTVCKSCE